MKYLLESILTEEQKNKIMVLKMEIDYELVTLHDAMIEKDENKKEKTKSRLRLLTKKLKQLEK